MFVVADPPARQRETARRDRSAYLFLAPIPAHGLIRPFARIAAKTTLSGCEEEECNTQDNDPYDP
jgi:hypothetical protein